jgi:hypothetical protein
LDDGKDAGIINHLCGVTSNDSDPSYISKWCFFLASKGKALTDANLIRTYTFAVDFIEKWQGMRITTKVSPFSILIELFPTFITGAWILQRHIYQALKHNASWFVPVHELVKLS